MSAARDPRRSHCPLPSGRLSDQGPWQGAGVFCKDTSFLRSWSVSAAGYTIQKPCCKRVLSPGSRPGYGARAASGQHAAQRPGGFCVKSRLPEAPTGVPRPSRL